MHFWEENSFSYINTDLLSSSLSFFFSLKIMEEPHYLVLKIRKSHEDVLCQNMAYLRGVASTSLLTMLNSKVSNLSRLFIVKVIQVVKHYITQGLRFFHNLNIFFICAKHLAAREQVIPRNDTSRHRNCVCCNKFFLNLMNCIHEEHSPV